MHSFAVYYIYISSINELQRPLMFYCIFRLVVLWVIWCLIFIELCRKLDLKSAVVFSINWVSEQEALNVIVTEMKHF